MQWNRNRNSGVGFQTVRLNSKNVTSLSHLQAMNKKMENESQDALNFLKQLKKEKTIQTKTSKIVKQGFHQVEKSGKHFAARMEEERTKYESLLGLVKYYEYTVYQDKKKRYEEEKNETKKINQSKECNKQNQNDGQNEEMSIQKELNEALTYLKQTERKYDDLVLKTNSSSYELSKKLDQVRILRSERTVCNGLFDQFEREIFDYELHYKQLVIERNLLNSIFLEKVSEFNKLEQQTQRHCEKIVAKNQEMLKQGKRNHTDTFSERQNIDLSQLKKKTYLRNIESTSEDRLPQIHEAEPWENIERDNLSSKRRNTEALEPHNNHKQNENQIRPSLFQQKSTNGNSWKEINQIENQKKVKLIFYDLQMKGFENFSFENLEIQIKNKYAQCEKLYERIYEKKKLLEKRDEKLKKKQRNIDFQLWKKEALQRKKVNQKYNSQIGEVKGQEKLFNEEIQNFKSEHLKSVGRILELKEVRNKGALNDEEQLKLEMAGLNKEFLRIFMKAETQNSKVRFDTEKDERDEGSQNGNSRLEYILNLNKTTKNTMNIYSEEELIKISRFNLQKELAVKEHEKPTQHGSE